MPARNVVLRPAAEDDLTGIYRYIVARSGYPERAIGYVRRIRAFCDTLATFPERGQRRGDLPPRRLCVGFARREGVAYTILANGDHVIGRAFSFRPGPKRTPRC